MEWSGAGVPVPVRPGRAWKKNVRFSFKRWATRVALAWIRWADPGKGMFSHDENEGTRAKAEEDGSFHLVRVADCDESIEDKRVLV